MLQDGHRELLVSSIPCCCAEAGAIVAEVEVVGGASVAMTVTVSVGVGSVVARVLGGVMSGSRTH